MFDELEFAFSLGSDNHSGVHPRALEAIHAANRGSAHAYGMDEVSELAREQFARVFGESVDPQYVFTGTAANILCLAPFVRPFEAVICSEVSHLHTDECGAPERQLGAKLWTLPSRDGKIRPEQCRSLLQRGGDQHFSQPRAVSLTQPTELGVCYTLDELREWREFCSRKNLMLHIDGARLPNAAAYLGVSLRDLTSGIGADAVSFGGTKNGLMGAEACLFFSERAKESFKYQRKQAMQLASKTRFLAAQFYAYLKNDFWREIAEHVTRETARLARDLESFPEIRLAHPAQSNALFVHMPREWIAPLRKEFFFYIWDHDTNLCRWMLSFDWSDDRRERLLAAITEVKKCFPAK